MASFIGTKLWDKYINSPDSKNYRKLLGPDFKILVYLNNDNNIYTWDRLTLSMPHSETFTIHSVANELYGKESLVATGNLIGS